MSPSDNIAQDLTSYFDAKDLARERSLRLSRTIIRDCGAAIRSVHREEFEQAGRLMDRAGAALEEINLLLEGHQDVRYAGFVGDAEQEYAEARIVYSIITAQDMPGPDEIKVSMASYLTGLGDVVGELRRHILDLIRRGRPEEGEACLATMEEIYHLLMVFDYPDAITRGLRRKSDVARSLLERTRGDLTNAMGRKKLEIRLQKLEDKLKEADHRL